jgi:enoyl-[acyl-carrier protein] reductase II
MTDMAKSRRFCSLFGIELPVLGAPMGGVAGPELAGAVSNAGGLGLLGLANVMPEDVRRQIRQTKAVTARPFGVGLLFPNPGEPVPVTAGGPAPLPAFLQCFRDPAAPPPVLAKRYDPETADENLAIAIAEGVPVLACGLGAPADVVERAKSAGMKVIALVGSRRAAIEVEAKGVDAIVAQGHEAGGHTGRTSTFVIVPQVVDAVRLPVVAAGGIVDGRGFAASIVLGASGVLVGTRLLATPEARTADTHKEKIVAMQDDETVVSRCYTGKPSRVLRNAFIDAWKGHEDEILPMPQQWERVAPVVVPAKAKGSLPVGNWPTGQGAVLVEDIAPAGEVICAIARDGRALLGWTAPFVEQAEPDRC